MDPSFLKFSTEPIYNMKAVAQRTGIPAPTLRAWERRYGLLQPQRTGKGHRLYPPGQVERIRQILTWLGRGVSVGQVSELLQRQEHQPLAHNLWQEQRQQLSLIHI